MNITKSPYIPGPDILYCDDSCVTKPVQLDFGEADMLPAGTPINPDGQVANDVTALGILLYDTYKGFGSGRALLLIGGHVDLAKAQEHSGITLSSEAKAELKSICFVGDTEVPSGGNDNIIFVNLTLLEGYVPKRYACDMKEMDVWNAVRAGKIVYAKASDTGKMYKAEDGGDEVVRYERYYIRPDYLYYEYFEKDWDNPSELDADGKTWCKYRYSFTLTRSNYSSDV